MDFENALAKLNQFGEKNHSASFDIFFNETKDVVYRVAYHYMRCEAEAEDILQSVYLKIFTYAQEKPEKIKEIVNLKSWMIQIAVNVSKMSIRTKIRLREKNMKKMNEENSYSTEKQELYEQVKKYLSDLPEKYRLPVCLHYVENMSFSEISAVLKIDQPTVKVQASRGIAKLKEILQKAGIAVSSSSLSSVLIESSFQKAPANISFLKPSLPISTRLEQVLGYAEKPAWYASKMLIFIASSSVLLLSFFLFFPHKNEKPEKNNISLNQAKNYDYNFEKITPKEVQIGSKNTPQIEMDKGLVVPGDEEPTILVFSDLKFNDQPYSVVSDIYTYPTPSFVQCLFGEKNKKIIWSRPASFRGNAWNRLKIIICGKYEVLFIKNIPVIIYELPINLIPKDEKLRLAYSNLVLRNVKIQALEKTEIFELEKYINLKIIATQSVATNLKVDAFSEYKKKGLYTLPFIKNLKKPIEIIINMNKPVPAFDGVHLYFLDSNDSPTEKFYSKVPKEYGTEIKFHIYLFDEICFIAKNNEDPSLIFETKSLELCKEIGFELDLNLVRDIQVIPIDKDSNIYEKTRKLFTVPSGNIELKTNFIKK